MYSDRRFLLKSLAATGLAISGVGWGAWAQATPLAGLPSGAAPMDAAADVLALTSGLPASAGAGVLDSAFITGVRSAAQTVRHTALQGLDSAPFQRLGQLLGDERSTLLVGLLDDASATLVLDLVRSAGGRVLSEQTHRIDGDAAAWTQALGQALALGQPVPAAPMAAGATARVAFRCLI